MNNKYIFYGHESFPCKSLWLKKGYDFIMEGNNFNSPDAVVQLGVGKNMVSSIRYWLKVFGIFEDDKLTEIAHYIFNNEKGRDPYMEDLGTLWLLHFLIVSTKEATLYNWFFTRFQCERKRFDRKQLQNFVHRCMIEADMIKSYNANTVRKDIAVLLQNYVLPDNDRSFEDFSSLLIDLDLIHFNNIEKEKYYYFNIDAKRKVIPDIFLYAIMKEKKDEQTVSYDTLQEIGLIFCMNDMEIIAMLKQLSIDFPDYLFYSDVAGIRQLQFFGNAQPLQILDHYYRHAEI